MKIDVTFEQDSIHARYVVPSRGYGKGLYESRTNPVQGIVVHTTGLEPVRLFEKAQKEEIRTPTKKSLFPTPFEAALWIYSNKMDAGGHYLVGQELGQIAQICPERFCAWHVGARDGLLKLRSAAAIYGKRAWLTEDAKWWIERWRHLSSPLDLAGGRLWDPYGSDPAKLRTKLASKWGSVNANTFGFDVVPPSTNPSVPWTRDCFVNIVNLALDCACRNQFAIEKERVISHSDGHPRARSKHGRPWDPSPEQWSWAEFARLAGIKEAT